MKDTIIKGDGTSRVLKAPASMPETYEEWRAQLLSGSATMDIGLNEAGCEVVGTALNKKSLLTDETATSIGELPDNPTVNEALLTLSRRDVSAIVNVYTPAGSVVTATLGNAVVSAIADESNIAVLHLYHMGTWSISIDNSGSIVEVPLVVDMSTVYNVSATFELEHCSWSFINTVVEAGHASQTWKVGDKKTFTLDGVSYEACIIGFNRDTQTEGGKAGITFQMVDCLNGFYKMDSASTSNWANSTMRTRLSEFFEGLSPELKKVIKAVDKKTSKGNKSIAIETTSDKLFLLSQIEVSGSTSYSASGEGSQYTYYSAGNSKIKKVPDNTNTNYNNWWLRSPNPNSVSSYCYVNYNGAINASLPTSTYGISFAFCI